MGAEHRNPLLQYSITPLLHPAIPPPSAPLYPPGGAPPLEMVDAHVLLDVGGDLDLRVPPAAFDPRNPPRSPPVPPLPAAALPFPPAYGSRDWRHPHGDGPRGSVCAALHRLSD